MIKKKDSPRLLFSLSGILTLLACLPVLALIWTALQGNSDIWGHLLRYVLPPTLVDTTLLLLGVGLLTILIGTGSAWLVTAYQFRGRAFFRLGIATSTRCPYLYYCL